MTTTIPAGHLIRILLDRHNQKPFLSCERRRAVWVSTGDCSSWTIAQRRRTVRSASSCGHGSGDRLARGVRAACSARVRSGQPFKASPSSSLLSPVISCLALLGHTFRPGEIDPSPWEIRRETCVCRSLYLPTSRFVWSKADFLWLIPIHGPKAGVENIVDE
jgi:hypothetical protein